MRAGDPELGASCALSRRSALLVAAAAAGSATCGTAQTPASTKAVTWPCDPQSAEAARAALGAPAVGFGIDVAGSANLLVAGRRMRTASAPVQAGDRWHWGSITKPMTATLIAMAVEAGALTWNDRPASRLSLAETHTGYRDVTLLHLLSHRAGLGSHAVDWEMLRFPRTEADARANRLLLAQRTLRSAPSTRPGSAFEYSNRGYVIAAAMLEKATGRTWESLISKLLFQRLGMDSAGFGAPGSAGKLDEPVGHASWLTESVTPHPPGSAITDNPSVLAPAGGMHASLADMLRFLRAHRDRPPLLSADTWTRLHTPAFRGDYALGWRVGPDGLWHDGTNTLWNAEVLISRRAGSAAAIVCNDGDYGKVSAGLHSAILHAQAPCVRPRLGRRTDTPLALPGATRRS